MIIIIVIKFTLLGMNTLWAPIRADFYPRLTSRTKISLSRAQNMLMRANIKSGVLIYLRLSLSLNWHIAGLLLGLLSEALQCTFHVPQ